MTDHTPAQDSGDEELVVEHVAELWRSMLQVGHVPPGARFVDLGGDSLLLLSVMTRLEDAYGVELDVDDVIEHMTVTGMAGLVVQALRS